MDRRTCILLLSCLCALVAGTECGGGGSSPPTLPKAPTLQKITVTPAEKTIAPGSSEPFSATGLFSDGSSMNLSGNVAWSASHPSVATVTGSGVAMAISDGTTNITATSSGVTGSTLLIVQSGSPDPLGSVAAQSQACPPGGVSGTACYSLTVSCPGISDIHAELKASVPAGNASGTIVFIGGEGGTGFYEGYTFGATIVDSVVQAGYTAIQISFMPRPPTSTRNSPGEWFQFQPRARITRKQPDLLE